MERIGRYQIECELGRGSMSIVYKALDPRIDRYIAIKVLRHAYARDIACRQRFLREARAAGGLSHPNIVTVFDVGQIEGIPYLAMELLEGETLAERLEREGHISTQEIIDLAIQLTRALTYAHERGVIHRDIKPANIQFDRVTGVVKLMDFGIADIQEGPRKPLADRGEIMGTPAYMAPEQILGRPPDGRTDLYALGVLLYHLLSGTEPFRCKRLSDLMAAIAQESPPPLVPLDPEAPRELLELVERLMAKAPGSRYARGDQVLEELEMIRASRERRLAHPALGNSMAWRWPLAVCGVVALVLGAGLWMIHDRQTHAITDMTLGYGEALASIIAQEIAEPMMLDDGTALSTLVGEFAANPQVVHLHFLDRGGVVVASTSAFLQGEHVARPEVGDILRESGSVRVVAGADEVLAFQVPVRFQHARIGQVDLGLASGELHAVSRLTVQMMALLFLVTLLAVLLGVYVLVRRLAHVAERLGWGLSKVGRGHYDFRLDVRRRDELGTLYGQFNDMAALLEQRHGSGEPSWPENVDRLPDLDEHQHDHAATLDLGKAGGVDGASRVTRLDLRRYLRR